MALVADEQDRRTDPPRTEHVTNLLLQAMEG